MNLGKHNFHWKDDFTYNIPLKRELYGRIVERIDEKQALSIIGLRRVGKTTILRQVIDHLIQSKTPRESIFYYSFDEEQPKIEEILSEYESRLGETIFESRKNFFILLDEIQKLSNWENEVKYYYDNYPNIKFFLSGSSSLFLKKKSRESLAGRIYEFVLPPLSFREYLLLSGKEDLLSRKRLLDESIRKELLLYAKRQFVETIGKNEELTGEYVRSILEKVIYQDIPAVFPVEHKDLLMRIMRVIASNPGMLSDYQTLSKELGVSRVTLSNYFHYLEESFLVKKIYNFSKNMLTSEKKMKKFYLSTPSFYVYLNNEVEESRLVENLAVTQANARFFFRDPFKNEVDMVLKQDQEVVPVEVKYKNTVTPKDIRGLIRFADKFGCQKAVVVTKDYSTTQEIKLKNGKTLSVLYAPAHVFLLNQSLEDYPGVGGKRSSRQ